MALLCVLLVLVGCGSTKPSTSSVSATDAQLAVPQQEIALAAVRCAGSAVQPGKGIALAHAVGELVSAYRQAPAAKTSSGEPLRTMLAKNAESLEGCWPDLARQLRNVLAYG